MSRRRKPNHGRPHPRRRGTPRKAVEQAAQMSCVIRGCTCTPDLEVRHVDGITHASISHDDWCPVVADEPT